MSEQPKYGERHVRRQIGAFSMVVGALMVTLCLGCSGWLLVSTTPVPGRAGGFYDRVFYGGIAVIGGLPTLVGLVLFVIGFRRYRK